eukprot:TRINITY_DN4437_c0_g1_i1.p2 TRINITY_DN4437_c0_g1~~TRINITY_DN4437_c0_g1_i1.p2  ORF type:complete len:258 (+),score=72.96 TRINITY_DN4437_c0_g1_i1:26-775(+)
MSVSSVIVLSPSGHRVTVSTSPGRTLMSVLEEVCSKRGHLEPSSYGLRHHGKALDLSLSIRFANLPNKAQLEMFKSRESLGPDGGTEVAPIGVPIVFQLEDGSRLPPTTETYPSTTVLEALFLAGVQVDPALGEPAVLYMRNETLGWEALQSTTLRTLGINSDAKILMRFSYKKADAPSILSSGNLSHSKKPKKEESVFSKVFNYVKDSTTASTSSSTTTEEATSTAGGVISKVSERVAGKTTDETQKK